MIYYIIVILILLSIFAYQYFTLTRIYYTSSALQQLREIRYEMTMKLSEAILDNTSVEKASEELKFLRMLNRLLKKLDKADSITVKSIEPFHYLIAFLSEQAEIQNGEPVNEYYLKTSRAVITSSKAIWLYKFRLFVYLGRMFFEFLIRLGFKKFRNELTKIEKIYFLKKELDHSTFPV